MSSSNASYGQDNVCLQDGSGVHAKRRAHSGFPGLVRIGVVAALTLTLSGCFRPLYGPTARGESLQAVMASIDVPENQLDDQYAQVEHYLRSDLIFNLNGSGIPAPKAYKLALGYSQSLVDADRRIRSRAAPSRRPCRAPCATRLTNLDGTQTVTTGTVYANATYDRFEQRFASLRAARDAEIRVARDLAEPGADQPRRRSGDPDLTPGHGRRQAGGRGGRAEASGSRHRRLSPLRPRHRPGQRTRPCLAAEIRSRTRPTPFSSSASTETILAADPARLVDEAGTIGTVRRQAGPVDRATLAQYRARGGRRS